MDTTPLDAPGRGRAALVAAIALASIALPLAGCIGTDGPPEQTGPADIGTTDTTDRSGVVEQTRWEGYIVAGAAYDLPGHFSETESLAEPVIRAGGALMFDGAPSMLEVELEWTGAPGTRAMLMVGPPTHTDEEGGNYATGFSEQHRQCIRIPADGLAEGHWSAMIHTLVGADVQFTITTRSVDTAPEWMDMHGHSVTEFYPEATDPLEFDECGGGA